MRLRRTSLAGSTSRGSAAARPSRSMSATDDLRRRRTPATSTPLGTTRMASGASPSAAAVARRRSSDTATYRAPGSGRLSSCLGSSGASWPPPSDRATARSWTQTTSRPSGSPGARSCNAATSGRLRLMVATLWRITRSAAAKCGRNAAPISRRRSPNPGSARPSSAARVAATMRGWSESRSRIRTALTSRTPTGPRPATSPTSAWRATPTAWCPMTVSTPPTMPGKV